MFRSRTAQIIIFAAGSAFTLVMATAGDRAHGEGNLDASYMLSFARIPVGEITATAVFGQSEDAMSARVRALVIAHNVNNFHQAAGVGLKCADPHGRRGANNDRLPARTVPT